MIQSTSLSETANLVAVSCFYVNCDQLLHSLATKVLYLFSCLSMCRIITTSQSNLAKGRIVNSSSQRSMPLCKPTAGMPGHANVAHPQNCPFPGGNPDPHVIRGYVGPSEPNGISIGSAVFAVLIPVTYTQRHGPRHAVCSNMPH